MRVEKNMNQLTIIQLLAVWILPVLFAVTVHEAMHGIAAYFFGDKTALMLGRLTLNPIKHIDLVGTIIVPLLLLALGGFIFGWAKPVPISVNNLKNPRRDMALVALAGPFANFVMMILWAVIAKFGMILQQQGFNWALAIFYMGQAGIMINALLMVLNLLPIPPLDGGHIVAGFLPANLALQFKRIEPFGFIILLVLLVSGLLRYLISSPIFLLQSFVSNMFGL